MLYRCLVFCLVMLTAPLAQAAKVVVFGDSLSAAYGLRAEQGWVSLLQQHLGPKYRVINASLTGETTAGGLARLPAVLKQHQPDILVLELGGNDGLRGLPLPAMQQNLLQMGRLAEKNGSKVLLVGMALPMNYGPDYGNKFRKVYEEVSRQGKWPLVPLLVAGFETDLSRFQPDGIHPTAAAQPRMLQNVLPALGRLLPKK